MHPIDFVPVGAIVGGVVIFWLVLRYRTHLRDLTHRERLAMIERGLMPPPELRTPDFERTASVSGSHAPTPENIRVARHRTGGILLIGFGLALALLIALAGGAPAAGLGVGGAIAIVGGAFFVNAVLESRRSSTAAPTDPAAAFAPTQQVAPAPSDTP